MINFRSELFSITFAAGTNMGQDNNLGSKRYDDDGATFDIFRSDPLQWVFRRGRFYPRLAN
jgi:hypothetical protein